MSCAIDIRDLRFRYPDGRVALDGLDLQVAHGERVALLGPNGAGKTTLALHLNGLLAGEGHVAVGDALVADDVWAARRRVGLVFQDPDDQLFMPTVAEDVAFAPLNAGASRDAARVLVDRALEAVGMAHAGDRAPHTLSGGERRRVAIATVLAQDPEVLVLDEPSANLDPRGRRELIELLDGLDRTMLVVTHDLPLAARLCDRAVVLSGGRVVADAECYDILCDDVLLTQHGLDLPDGFVLDAVTTGTRRMAVAG